MSKDLHQEKLPEIITELMRQHPTLSEQADIAEDLRGYQFPAPPRKKVRTVAAFYYCANNGGVERVLCDLLSLWHAAGYRVILLTDRPATDEDYPLPSGIHRYLLPDTFHLDDEKRLERYREIQRIVRDEQVDVFVHHAWLSENMLWDLLAVKLLGVPFLPYIHGVFSCLVSEGNPEQMDILRCLTQIYPLADGVLSLSQTSQKFWSRFQSRSFLLVNPCRKPHRITVSRKKHHMVWVGRIAPEKRPLDAVKILHEVRKKQPEATLTIVGSAHPVYRELYHELQALITALHEEEAVLLAGYQEDPYEYYQEAELLLSTSAYEGFSLVIAEAKTYGVPCVMYDLPYLLFSEERQGVIPVEQQHPEKAAEAVLQCFEDEEKLRKLSEEALLSSRIFDDEALLRQWKDIFEQIMEHQAPVTVSADAVAWNTMLEHLHEGLQKWSSEKQVYLQRQAEWQEKEQEWEQEKNRWQTEREAYIRREQESFRLLRRIKRAFFH